jgi:hypothetical protein
MTLLKRYMLLRKQSKIQIDPKLNILMLLTTLGQRDSEK